ncbi:MAG: creatininase family protein [Thermoplasmata archaeon]
MYWHDLTFKEIEEKINDKLLVILPIGSVEEHGYHLPLNSDSAQAIYVSEEIAKKCNSLILPPIYYGYTELKDYKGTISIRYSTLYNLVFDILSKVVDDGVKNILIISGHASSIHMAAIRDAANEIVEKEPVKIMFLSDYDIAYELRSKLVPGNDSHAGIIETSRMMAIRPDLVKKDFKFTYNGKGKFMVISNYSSIYPEGTLSDPNGSSPELGRKINEYVVEKLWEMVKENFNL